MAKAERGARSRAIREYLGANPQAGPKDVVEALKAQGLTVTHGLVSSIKYGKRTRKRGRKKTGSPATMSDAIRNYLTRFPTATPSEVRSALAKQGVTVRVGLISNVKHNLKRKPAAAKVRAAARKTTAAAITVPQLLELKQLVDSIGGLDHVRHALDALEQLR